MKKAVAMAISLLIMGIIFFLSAQPGETSSKLSNEVTVGVADSAASNLVPAVFSENMNANIRKWAHVLLYFALGMSMTATIFSFRATKQREMKSCLLCALFACLICLLYAASDEIHQIFVPGRAGMISDVMVDMLGALPGVLLVALWVAYRARKKFKK